MEEWEIPEYCSIIYILKTRENILSFFEMSELLQLKFCDFYTNTLKDYNEDLSKTFFEVLLEVVNIGKYTERDFDFLFDVLLNSRFIAELGTKENIYEFLTLDIKKRKQIYDFYKNYSDDFNADINRLSLNFILYIANKYTKLSAEQFNYLMKLISMSNLANFDSIDRKYIEDLKEKGINPFILETFQYVDSYNRYLLDLLFSDIDEKYIDVFESKLQRIINLFDSLRQYEISNLETENKALALIVFLSNDFEKYCKDNNITDIVKQYQLAIRVARRIFTLSGKNIFDVSKQRLEKIVKATLSYYEKIDEISSLFNVFTDKTAVFSLYNSERNFDGTQRFTPAGLKELFGILDINPEVCCFIEISFIDTVSDFINSIDDQYLDKKQILDFIDQTDGSIVVKDTLKKHIKAIKGTAISKDNLVKYIRRIKEQQIENEITNYLGMLENFKKFELEHGTFLFDGHGLNDSFFYSQTGKITVERLVKSLVAAHNNGVNLENITLMFSSCNSYDFANKIITGLIDNRIYVHPQIITDAGKETALAYDTQIETSLGKRRVSNLFYSILMSLKSKTAAEIEQMKGRLTFKEVADVPRYLSNNTIFMTNQQVEDLNHELEETIHQIIEEFDSEDEERFYPVMEDGKYVGAYNPYVELMLSSHLSASYSFVSMAPCSLLYFAISIS